MFIRVCVNISVILLIIMNAIIIVRKPELEPCDKQVIDLQHKIDSLEELSSDVWRFGRKLKKKRDALLRKSKGE